MSATTESTTSTTDTGAQTAQGTFIQPTAQTGAAAGQQQTEAAATATDAGQQTAAQAGQGDGAQQQGQDGQQETGKGSKDAVLADLAKERDKRQESEQKLDAVLTALGLKEAGQDVDPKQAAADLAATRAENAVLRVGAGIADVDALLDSRTFTDSLTKVDTADRAAVKAHIEAFVQAHPRYATQAAGQGPVPAVRDAGAGAHQQTATGSGDWLRDAINRR